MNTVQSPLPPEFLDRPAEATILRSTKDTRDFILYYERGFIAKGQVWDLKHKSIGAGVYRIWLEPQPFR